METVSVEFSREVMMDIAAVSIMLNQAKVQQQAGLSVMKMAMDMGKTQANGLIEMMEQSVKALEHTVLPHLGGYIDITL